MGEVTLKKLSLVIAVGLLAISVSILHAQNGLGGTVTSDVNLRATPSTNAPVVTVIPIGSAVTVLGKDSIGLWFYVSYSGDNGWVAYNYVRLSGNRDELPTVGSDGRIVSSSAPTVQSPSSSENRNSQHDTNSFGDDDPNDSETINEPTSQSDVSSDYSTDYAVPVTVPGNIVTGVTGTSRRIFEVGQSLGNRADVFSKVGDSITASNLFLDPIGHGTYDLSQYGHLQSVIGYFSQTGARDHFSFANTSLAARNGFTSAMLLDPRFAAPGVCQPGESPLECEYRVVRPSIALIMIGTNDTGQLGSGSFRANLERIVEISIDRGIIPVLSTIPDQPGTSRAQTVIQFNSVIEQVSGQYDIPLWHYWQSMQGLPNSGMSEDNIHPSFDQNSGDAGNLGPIGLQYGYNLRNLTALQVLDTIWRQVILAG